MPATLRFKPTTGGRVAILNPQTGLHEVPDPSRQYPADHPLVVAAPWAFGSEDDIAAAEEARDSVTAVPIADVAAEIEQATASPGEKRSTRRATASQ